MMQQLKQAFPLLCLLGLFPLVAQAHQEVGAAAGFVSGFLHPLFGLDHVVAMVAVGLLGAIMGPPALWLLPVVFPLVMAFGGVLGVIGLPLPGIEIGIALSGIVLGLLVALAIRPKVWLAAILVGVFAIFHGHAHGTELPHATSPLAYGIGFVVATGMLHLSGIAIGLLFRWPAGALVVRAAGLVIAAVGVYFLLPHLTAMT